MPPSVNVRVGTTTNEPALSLGCASQRGLDSLHPGHDFYPKFIESVGRVQYFPIRRFSRIVARSSRQCLGLPVSHWATITLLTFTLKIDPGAGMQDSVPGILPAKYLKLSTKVGGEYLTQPLWQHSASI